MTVKYNNNTTNNKRIAKNTALLYFRMLLLMLVNLYASRVVLAALGVEDYGLYSLVGGVVSFLGFINASMTSASQRFLSFSLGNEQGCDVTNTFNSVFRAHAIIAIFIFILAETLGVFYIQNYLNCAPDKVASAHLVFQFSLLAIIVKTISVPYTASIIAHEKMNAFALLSIIEGSMQFAVATSLSLFDSHRIIFYSVGMFISVLVVQIGYQLYCKRYFLECKLRKGTDTKQIVEIFKYSGWNLLGALSSVAIEQGVNMILNGFCGVVVNAARGIAFQVSAAVSSLAGNFQQALNPQIVKTYAKHEIEKLHMLLMSGTRLSFFLLLMLAFPIFCNLHEILIIWLKDVPPYTECFCRLVLINSLVCAFSNSIMTGVLATGNIKKYQIIVSSINMANFPISYIVMCISPNPYYTMFVMIVLSVVAFIARLILSSRLLMFSKKLFFENVIVPILYTTATLVIVGYLSTRYISHSLSFTSLVVNSFLYGIIGIVIITLIGLKQDEKKMLFGLVKGKIKH